MARIVNRLLGKVGLELRRRDEIGTQFGAHLTVDGLHRVTHVARRYQEILDVPGDIVECGVAGGRSFLTLCTLASSDPQPRRVFGFDSFKGFPEPSVHDASGRQVTRGEKAEFTRARLEAVLRRAGLDPAFLRDGLTLVEGFVEDTVHRYDGDGIALLHIDLDLHDAYKATLEALWPRVVPGGVVLFDEYDDPKWPGATKAINDFFGDAVDEIVRDPLTGKHWIRRRDDD